MNKNKIFLGVDIGSSCIKAVAGKYDKSTQSIELVSYGIGQNTGIEYGYIKNMNQAVNALRSAINQLSEAIDMDNITSVICNISGTDLFSTNARGLLAFKESKKIDDNILEELDDNSISSVAKENKSVVFLTNKSYNIDDGEDIHDPFGLEVNRIEADNFILYADNDHITNIRKLFSNVGIKITDIIPDAIAASEVLIKQSERDMGISVLDIGYTKTDIAIFTEGNIQHNKVIPNGIKDIIHMISYVYKLSFEDACYVYNEYANLLKCNSDEEVSLGIDYLGKERFLHIGEFNRLIEDLIKQLLARISNIITNEGYSNRILSGYVLTGGLTKLRGAKNAIGNVVGQSKIKVGRLYGTVGCNSISDDGSFSSAIGMLKLAISDSENEQHSVLNVISDFFSGIFDKIISKQEK